MTDGLTLLCAADFDWAMHLQGVWTDPPYDVPEFQSTLRHQLCEKLHEMHENPADDSPLGWVVVGTAGSGKTHLLSILRRESFARQIHFVLVDMTDVHDFWATVLLGYFNSLQQNRADGRPLRTALIERLLSLCGPLESVQEEMDTLRRAEPTKLAQLTAGFLDKLWQYAR